MAASAVAGGRRPSERAAAHKAAYAKGLSGQPAGDAETNDPRLRASYREGLRASRGEVAPRPSAQPKRSTLASEADAFSASHTKPKPGAPTVARPSDVPAPVRRLGASSGGFVLGMVAYAIAINYLRYGLPGVKAFASAKLFNKVTPGPWSTDAPTGLTPGQLNNLNNGTAGGGRAATPTGLRIA